MIDQAREELDWDAEHDPREFPLLKRLIHAIDRSDDAELAQTVAEVKTEVDALSWPIPTLLPTVVDMLADELQGKPSYKTITCPQSGAAIPIQDQDVRFGARYSCPECRNDVELPASMNNDECAVIMSDGQPCRRMMFKKENIGLRQLDRFPDGGGEKPVCILHSASEDKRLDTVHELFASEIMKLVEGSECRGKAPITALGHRRGCTFEDMIVACSKTIVTQNETASLRYYRSGIIHSKYREDCADRRECRSPVPDFFNGSSGWFWFTRGEKGNYSDH